MLVKLLQTCTLIIILGSGSQVSEAIIQGETAKNGQFPYVVAIYRNGNFFCTGSLISSTAILTAAHCVVVNNAVQNPSRYIAVIGSVNRHGYNRVRFNQVIPHPYYNKERKLNDVAVMRMTKPVQFDDTTKPICLPKADTDLNKYQVAVAMGWGDIVRGEQTKYPGLLMYVAQDVLTRQLCYLKLRQLYGYSNEDNSRICTREYTQLVEGICSGDSGGPLVNFAGDEPIQIGVASFGSTNCGERITASTRVSHFIDFITAAAGEICTK